MSCLIAIKGPRIGAHFDIDEHTTLGRAPDCTIEIPDEGVSRVHAEIVRRRKAFVLKDCHSSNGTYLNKRKITEAILKPNDEIRIGSSLLVFDPDYEIMDARFSGATVRISAPLDETVTIKKSANSKKSGEIIDNHTLDLVQRLTELAEPFEKNLPDMLEELIRRLVHVFKGERGMIMLWDSVLKELQPVVTVSPGNEKIVVSRKVINTTFFDKTPLLVSGPDTRSDVKGDISPSACSSLSVPLIFNNICLGIVYIDQTGEEQYDLKSLGLLQAVGKMIAYAIHHSRMMEKMLLEKKEKPEYRIIGKSPQILALKNDIERLADTDATVLIQGETGTGKEITARELHEGGRRRDYPFIVMNCNAVPEPLFESELFGHERGAFTGADKLHRGKVEMAHGGTLFLDEIGDLALSVQPKLLRFLQEKNFYRVGGNKSIKVNVRIVAATNCDLDKMIKKRLFREDLYFRLSVIPLFIAPLRDRPEDVRLLAEYFLQEFSRKMMKSIRRFSTDAIKNMEKYHWPGNVRELKNTVERAVILCNDNIIEAEHVILEPATGFDGQNTKELKTLAEIEKEHIRIVLSGCGGNQVRAAKILGIHRNTLRNKIEEYNL